MLYKTTAEAIRRLRNMRDLNQEQLAELSSLNRVTISKYESGKVEPSAQALSRLADALDVSVDVLLGRAVMGEDLPRGMLPLRRKAVPLVGDIACGTPITAEENIEGYDNVPAYVKADFTLVCRGDSMTGARIYDGDIVCIRQCDSVNSGEIAAVLVDGEEATLKRVRLQEDGIVLWPENPAYQPMIFTGADARRVRIIGKATHFISVVR